MTLPLEKAYYAARATETPIAFGTSENGNTQIAVEFTVIDGDFAGEAITWIGHFTDKTAERTVEALQIAGWSGDDLSELADVPANQALQAEVSLTVEGEADLDGHMRPKVRWVNRPGGGRFKFKQELTGNDLKAFAAQMRNTVKSVRAAGGTPRAPRQTRSSSGGGHANRPGDRDDVPPPSDNDGRW
jgi:hypothetical protein